MLFASSRSRRRPLALLGALILLAVAPLSAGAEQIAANDERIQLSGRWDTKSASPSSVWSAATVCFRINGTACKAIVTSPGDNYLSICVDGKFVSKTKLGKTKDPIAVAEGLTAGEHLIELVNATEPYYGSMVFGGLDLPAGTTLLKAPPVTRRIEFLGDSITCGYGNEDSDRNHHFKTSTANAALTYGVFAARQLKADWTCVAISGIWLSQPMDPTKEPLPKIYPRMTLSKQSSWDFTRDIPDAVVINLGTNDSGGKPFDADKYKAAWVSFVSDIRKNYPKAHIFCTIGPMGQSKQMQDYITQAVAEINTAGDAKVYDIKLPRQDEKIDGIGADWHPTVKCHQRVADVLAPMIAEKMGWKD